MAKPQRRKTLKRSAGRVGYGLPTVLAVALHLGILVISVIKWPSSEPEAPNNAIVQATLISTETRTDQAQQAAEARTRAAERQAQEEAERQAQEEAERQAREAAEQQAAEEAERQAAEQQAQQEAEQQAREEAAEQAQAEAERRAAEAEAAAQRKAEEEAEREAARQQAEQERQAEAERRREEEAARQQEAERQAREEAEQKAREEAEQQAREEAERKAQEEAERQAREAAEQKAREEAERQLQRIIEGDSSAVSNAEQGNEAANGFIQLVRRAVEQAWVIPPNVGDGTTAEVQVRLGPSGEVFAATVTRSSGNAAFDNSAIQAVESAAPFTELRDLPSGVQRDYRQFNLRFRPGDIR